MMSQKFPHIDTGKPTACGGLTMRIEPTVVAPKRVSSRSSQLIRRSVSVYQNDENQKHKKREEVQNEKKTVALFVNPDSYRDRSISNGCFHVHKL